MENIQEGLTKYKMETAGSVQKTDFSRLKRRVANLEKIVSDMHKEIESLKKSKKIAVKKADNNI